MKYSKSFRNVVLRKVLPPENRNVSAVAKESPSVVTINSWLSKLKDGKITVEQDSDCGVNKRSLKEKFDLVLERQIISKDKEGEWLRQHGLHSEHIPLFEQELKSYMSNKNNDKNKRIKELEKKVRQQQKELVRKDAALAEVAAILTLKKTFGDR